LSSSDALVRTINGEVGHVLLAGDAAQRSALYLAANGCEVTAVESEEAMQRVLEAAIQAGLAERVHAVATELSEFQPDSPLFAVVCSHATLATLSRRERARVLNILQTATQDGGVHLVETIIAGSSALDELRATYTGWQITIEPASGNQHVFLARKEDHVSH
jgi:hypothetical protein